MENLTFVMPTQQELIELKKEEEKKFSIEGDQVATITGMERKIDRNENPYIHVRYDLEEGGSIKDFISLSKESIVPTRIKLAAMSSAMLDLTPGTNLNIESLLKSMMYKTAIITIKNKENKQSGMMWPQIIKISKYDKMAAQRSSQERQEAIDNYGLRQQVHQSTEFNGEILGDEIPF